MLDFLQGAPAVCWYLIEFPVDAYQVISVFSPEHMMRIYQLFTFPSDISPVHLHKYCSYPCEYFEIAVYFILQRLCLFVVFIFI